ncbi:MAG: hypothetical protein ISR65_15320 [Bacteriovoracaceae bacterium]|nr:hypothetical protein [Bacteriovoracaceae bacterium]
MHNQKVVALSRCIKTKVTTTKLPNTYTFHFKGMYMGVKIKSIHIISKGPLDIKKGEDYMLYLKVKTVTGGILNVDLINCKKLSEFYF